MGGQQPNDDMKGNTSVRKTGPIALSGAQKCNVQFTDSHACSVVARPPGFGGHASAIHGIATRDLERQCCR